MKNERLLIVTVCVALGSGCLAFGYSTETRETVDITDQSEVLETVKTVKTVKAGNPIEGSAIVVEVNETGIIFVDIESGIIRLTHGKRLYGTIMPGDEISYVMIHTPNGNVVTHIKERN